MAKFDPDKLTEYIADLQNGHTDAESLFEKAVANIKNAGGPF